MQRRYQIAGLCLMAAFAAWCVVSLRADLSRISLQPLLHSWQYLALAMFLSLLNYSARAIRWRFYLSKLGHSLAPSFSALTYVAGFAFTLSPGKIGEIVRARYYTNLKVPVRDVAGAVLVERIVDLAAMSLLATLILTALPEYTHAVWSAGAIIALLLGLLTVLPWDAISRSFKSTRRLARPLANAISEAAGALSGARALIQTPRMLFGVFVGLVGWGLEGLGLAVLASMFVPNHLDPAVAVGIYAIAILVGAVLFLPGGLGGTEAAMTTLLATQGYGLPEALLITLACRFATLWFAVALGWSAVAWLRYTRG